MGKLSKEQITAIEYELASPFGRVELACDGYKINVSVEPKAARKYVLFGYVNGEFKGAWSKGNCEEATRFLRPVTLELFKPTQKAKIIKDMGKRHGSKFLDEYNKTSTYYEPIWQSVRSMLRHFCKYSEAVSVTSIGYSKSRQDGHSDTTASLEPAV